MKLENRIECADCGALIKLSATYTAERDPQSAPVCWGCGPGKIELAQVTAERDNYEQYWQPLLQAMQVSSIDAAVEWTKAMVERSKELAALHLAMTNIKHGSETECGCNDHSSDTCCNQAGEFCAYCQSSAALLVAVDRKEGENNDGL
jgi:hypothetical protein